MAPVTRARRRKDSVPLVLVLSGPSGSHPAPELTLPQQLEDSTTPAAPPPNPKKQKPTTEGTDKLTNGTIYRPPPPPEDKPTNPAAADSESDSGDDDDDEAPEAVSLDTGREAARKAQDEAKRAAEAQADAARLKRKARDAKLKEQKEEANERKRKRRKVNPEDDEEVVDNSKALTIAEKSAEPLVGEANVANSSPFSPPPTEGQLRKPTPPTLLPETLLAQVAATKRRRHREQPDSHPKPEHEPEQKKQVTGTGIDSRNAERNRRKKQRQKLNRTLKKGPVSVKVLKDDTKSRKILPPPTAKVVGSIKDSWLFGRKTGGAVRRDVVTGFVKK